MQSAELLTHYYLVAVCDFPTIRDAAAVVPDLTRAGVQIGAVELLDEVMMKAIRLSNPELGYEEKPTLFFKFVANSKAQIEHDIKVVAELAKKHQGGQFKYAKTEAEKEALWEGRKVREREIPYYFTLTKSLAIDLFMVVDTAQEEWVGVDNRCGCASFKIT